jgi:hypothetical protein
MQWQQTKIGVEQYGLMLGVAGLTDFAQAKSGILVSVPVVGFVAYFVVSGLIGLFAMLTFLLWIKILEVNADAKSMRQTRRGVKRHINRNKSQGALSRRISSARNAVALASNPTRYVVRRFAIYSVTFFFEIAVGAIPAYTVMIIVLYLTDRAESKIRKHLGEHADELALAVA